MEILFDILIVLGVFVVLGAICGVASACARSEEEKTEAPSLKVEKQEESALAAFVKCHGGNDSKRRFTFSDTPDCLVASKLYGGMTECPSACLGLGTCASACPSHAISVEDGVAVVDEERCDGCGMCVSLCPRGVIALAPRGQSVRVRCSNPSEGYAVGKVCEVGCIACGSCVKTCKYGAIEIKDNVAVIDYEKCTFCGACADVCERGVITAPPAPPEEAFDEDEYFELSLEEEEFAEE